ncbi:hypothetical protein EZV62_007751 [Acer yangbiense]|uniref:MLO-like protein n=1 Tax=Acer yangbiense TaxID=1000413 RepID=A0A5C7IDG2_9ROSI|nr:hypothetical protein EZV62_007751 [Acer yangbiense]
MSGAGGASEEGTTLEYTPTWIVAALCTVIVAISLGVERLLHFLGKLLKKKQQKPLYEALQKVKEELMLLGFISLLLTVFQNAISKMCISPEYLDNLLPCKLKRTEAAAEGQESNATTTSHFQTVFASSIYGKARRLLAESSASETGYCSQKDKAPLLSVEALHHLHIFIFVLAIVHVTFCVLTVVFGGARIRQWKRWEDSIADTEQVPKNKVTHLRHHDFIKEHFLGIGKDSALLGWVHSFFKQFYASVTRADYETLRLGFIMMHCRGSPKFNFHKYMMRALEVDFKRVVGIRQLVSLDICGRVSVAECWHTYFWIAFIPFIVGTLKSLYNCPFLAILLLAVGAKLEHVISQLAHEVAEKHIAIEGDLVVQPSDEHFWFNRPCIILFLIHFILFQNSFEIAFFFWIWVQYGFDSCIMGQVRYIVPRLIIGVIIQVLCSYSTLPLYAIVTQMGTSFKKEVFEEHVQVKISGWAKKVKEKKGLKADTEGSTTHATSHGGIQLGKVPEEIRSSQGADGSK